MHAVLVIATTAFVLAIAPGVVAQKVSGPPWWSGLQVPDDATQTGLIQNVQRTVASAFDPTLPPAAFDAWLWVTLAPFVESASPRLLEWRVSFCLDRKSDIPRTGPELCVEGTATLSGEKHVQIVIAVAEALRSTATGRLRWRATPPSLRDIYIERLKDSAPTDSLDVPTLGALPKLLDAPFEQWPVADFQSTITWDPPNPAPGQKVRFNIVVRNTGKRSVDYTWIRILIGPCCAHTEVRHEWFPRLAAGGSVSAEVVVPLPEGRAIASVLVEAWQGGKRVRESSPEKLRQLVAVGYPPGLRF